MPAPTTRNECGVVTIYPMTVTCNPTNPTSAVASDGSISLTIYGGSPPYSIEWTNGSFDQALYNLSVGTYKATVTDYNEDYTQVITCTLTQPTPSTTIPPGPTTTTLPEYDICLSRNGVGVSYIPDGFVNGKNSWIADDNNSVIFWDTSLTPDSWRLTGNGITELIINSNPAYPPINGWQLIGGVGGVNATLGECSTSNELDFTLTKEDPGCSCDGVITVGNVTGGVGGYQYSFINSYQLLPFKNGLCGGSYAVTVKDGDGNTKTKSITLNTVQSAVNYLLTTTLINEQNLTPTSKKWVFGINCFQTIPVGVVFEYDFTTVFKFTRGPLSTSSTSTCSANLIINGSVVGPLTVTSTETTSINNAPGSCNGGTLYNTNYQLVYNNITHQNGSDIKVEIIMSYNSSCAETCCTNMMSNVNNSVSNTSVTGCDCCSVGGQISIE